MHLSLAEAPLAYWAHRSALRSVESPSLDPSLSWEDQERAADAWNDWVRASSWQRQFETYTEALVGLRARLLQTPGNHEHRTWGSVSTQEGSIWTRCTWHDPLALAIVSCDDRSKQQLHAAGLLDAVVECFGDQLPVAAMTFQAQHVSWSMGYPALMAVLLANQKEPLVSFPFQNNYWDIESHQRWGLAVESSLFGAHPEFWRTGLTEAMDALLVYGVPSSENTLTALRLLTELGGMASREAIELGFNTWDEKVHSGRGHALLETLRARSNEHRLDTQWPQGSTRSSRPRF